MTTKVKDAVERAPLQPLLTVEDLERLLRVDRRTVARLCKRGQLPVPLKLGGSNRWRAEDITKALNRLGQGDCGHAGPTKGAREPDPGTSCLAAEAGVLPGAG
jgi:predicted DNA-binding transcriptional regulator AlpA